MDLHEPKYTLMDAARATGYSAGTLSQQFNRGLIQPTLESDNPHKAHLYSAIDIVKWALLNRPSKAAGIPLGVARGIAFDAATINGQPGISAQFTTEGVDAWLVVYRAGEDWRARITFPETFELTSVPRDLDAIFLLPIAQLVRGVLWNLK